MTRFLVLKHVVTDTWAIGIKAPDGCVLVQFSPFRHPQSHGWWLYPRHHFKRRRRKFR